jgi:hypothetical protein
VSGTDNIKLRRRVHGINEMHVVVLGVVGEAQGLRGVGADDDRRGEGAADDEGERRRTAHDPAPDKIRPGGVHGVRRSTIEAHVVVWQALGGGARGAEREED